MSRNDTDKKERVVSGTPISNGLAMGKASIIRRFASDTENNSTIDAEDIKEEIARLKQALQMLLVILQCSEDFLLNKSNMEAAGIFSLQRAFLMDPFLMGQFYQAIEKKMCSAESALRLVLNDYAYQFSLVDNPRVRERIPDIHDIRNMLLDALSNPLLLMPEKLRKKNNAHARIAIAFELTPRLVIEQNMIGIKGIIAENGGRSSHAAILCQALGIPAISGIKGATETIGKDRTVLVNGTEGTVIVSPSRKTVFRVLYNRLMNQIPKQIDLKEGELCPLSIMATINFARESRNSSVFQADGIGLYRTEMECIALRRFLSEDEQLYRYMEVLENMEGRPVYIRLMDLGGDKKIFGPGDGRTAHSNSRGSQYLLENPEVLNTQARALARASKNQGINVIYPMISDIHQFLVIKAAFLAGIPLFESGAIRHGVMFETPAACRQARELIAEADFASIGTNDLTEHLFNVDRNSDQAHQAASRPALWEMIEMVVKAGREKGKPVFVCGELAKRSEFFTRFIEFGVNGISVPIKMIPEIRNQIATKS